MAPVRTVFAAGILALCAASPALADDGRCGNVAAAEWMSVQEIAGKADTLGIQVREVERDDGCYQVNGIDGDGRRVELHMHPTSAEVVKRDFDD